MWLPQTVVGQTDQRAALMPRKGMQDTNAQRAGPPMVTHGDRSPRIWRIESRNL